MRGPRYFYFALAHELHMTVAELLSRLDAYELTEWQAYFAIRDERKASQSGNTSVDDQLSSGMMQYRSWG